MGNPNRGLTILGVSMVSNTFLNWVLIFGNLGAPALGVEGATLATLLARVLACAIAGNITNLCTVGVFAIAGTAAILIGQEIGSGRTNRVYSLGALLNALAFLFGLGAGAT